jgi:predicted nucleic acid-binding Zn ribbon protein
MFEKDVVREKPNKMWSMLDEESEWVNPNFDRSAGTYVQPKRSMYNNSKAYGFIQSIPELKALYDELLNAMHESNDKINFIEQSDDYKLPQMSARLMTVLRRSGNIFKNIGHYVADEMSVRGDDVDYVEKATIRPDGTPLYHVPTKFMQRLKDPNMIT